jgi:hypothetical protein
MYHFLNNRAMVSHLCRDSASYTILVKFESETVRPVSLKMNTSWGIRSRLIIRFIKCALPEKEIRIQREKEFEERQRQKRKRQELFEAIQREKERVHNLEIEVENWHRAEKTRAYVEAVKGKAKENLDAETVSLAEWVTWAQQQADRLDPLAESLFN